MDDRTVRALKALNRRFYQHHAADFSITRESPWRGWEKLLPHLQEALVRSPGSRILDAGCGNGRFLHWLADECPLPFVGLAADRSLPLLQAARGSGPQLPAVMELAPQEGTLPLRPDTCGAVVAMGVLHHIPARDLRRGFIRELVRVLSAQGVLALTAWQFADHPRFKARTQPWALAKNVDESQIEAGDHLLRWGRTDAPGMDSRASDDALRYCHHTGDEELTELTLDLGLKLIDEYRADGATGDMNLYRVWRRIR